MEEPRPDNPSPEEPSEPDGQADNPFRLLGQVLQMQRGQTLFLMAAVAFVALEDRSKPGHMRPDAKQVRDEMDGIMKVFDRHDLRENPILNEDHQYGARLMHRELIGLLDEIIETNPPTSGQPTKMKMLKGVRDLANWGLLIDRLRDL